MAKGEDALAAADRVIDALGGLEPGPALAALAVVAGCVLATGWRNEPTLAAAHALIHGREAMRHYFAAARGPAPVPFVLPILISMN